MNTNILSLVFFPECKRWSDTIHNCIDGLLYIPHLQATYRVIDLQRGEVSLDQHLPTTKDYLLTAAKVAFLFLAGLKALIFLVFLVVIDRLYHRFTIKTEKTLVDPDKIETILEKKKLLPKTNSLEDFDLYMRKQVNQASTKYECLSEDIVGNSLDWVQFQKKETESNNVNKIHISIFWDSVNKIHISIFRDRENIKKAFDVIFPILDKYAITRFKIVSEHSLKSCLQDNDNAVGKEFVIYISDSGQEKDKTFWENKVLKEISEGLCKGAIKWGVPSKGDMMIPGSRGFFYRRSSINILDNYMPADFLEGAGFTKNESATISSSTWDNLSLENTKSCSIEEMKIKTNYFTNIEPQRITDETVKTIYSSFFDDVEKREEKNLQAPLFLLLQAPLFLLIGGYHDGPALDHTEMALLQFLYKCDGINLKHKSYFYKNKIQSENFLNMLNKSSSFTAFAFTMFSAKGHTVAKEKVEYGRILPAIYRAFIVPFVKMNKVNETLSCENFFKDDEAVANFIVQVAECAFRTKESQINSDRPKYQIDISQVQLITSLKELYEIFISQ